MTTLASSLPLPRARTLGNRIAKAAMSERLATPEGGPSEGLVRLYTRWAEGGAGLFITGNVMVDSGALGETGNVVLEDARHLDAFRAWARAAQSRGAQVWMQINHPGRQSPRFLSREPVAPSAVPMRGTAGMFAPPRALEPGEIEAIVARFARTAALAEAAGFDGVQIHGAHGYLISQFLSPLTNRRTDAYGGTPERRRRFLLEIVRAVRAATRPGFAVGVKLNSADFQRGGFTEDESMQVVEALGSEAIDLLEISGGTYEAAAMFDEPKDARTRGREAFFLDYAERVRARTAVPLMVTGGFRTAAGMAEALRTRATDVIGLARPLALEPDLPARLLSGVAAAARPVRLAIGWKKLDSVIQGGWYQAQLERVAAGREPDPRLGRLRAIVTYLRARPRQVAPSQQQPAMQGASSTSRVTLPA